MQSAAPSITITQERTKNKMPSPNVRRVPYSSLSFNSSAQRYFHAKTDGGSGKFISASAVRGIIDDDIDVQGKRMVGHGEDLKKAAADFKTGAIGQDEYNGAVRQWRDNMAASIKGLHLGNAAAAKGGFHAMEQSDFGRVGGLLRSQYAYLENFAIEVAANPDIVLGQANGKQGFDDRASSYAEAGRHTYEAVRVEEHRDNGFLSEQNRLEDGAMHCAGADSCIEQTDKGRVKLGTLILPGRRKCGPKCKCEVDYFKEAA